MTPRQWYEILNHKVFFWPTLDRVLDLVGARSYRKDSHIVLTLDTRNLLFPNSGRIFLSRINSGQAIFQMTPRGSETFVPLSEWPSDVKIRSNNLKKPVAEVAIEYSVPNIIEVTVRVDKMRDGEKPIPVWAS
jgi:hypothetical protein